MDTKKNKLNIENRYFLIVIAVLAILTLFPKTSEVSTIQGKWDISQQVLEEGYTPYLVETQDFDYTHPDVYKVAQEIKGRTSTPDDAIKETLRFVVQNIQYSSDITMDYCYSEKASTALNSGVGDCVSMSRLVTALLRAQGIPARTMGGCLSATKRCAPIFAVIPFLDAQVTPMTEGDFKKRGFLHEWVEVWNGNEWLVAESTSGQLFPMSCYSNTYLTYGYDTNPRDRCVIFDSAFWSTCKNY